MMHHELRHAIWPEPPPPRTLRCRHCGKLNRVDVPTAALEPHTVRCGACDGPVFLGPDEPYPDLTPAAWQHPRDHEALASLQAVPGFAMLVRRFVAAVPERSMQLTALASYIRVDADQFPELYDVGELTRARLGYRVRPTLFLAESPTMNAMTIGAESPLIVVYSALLDQLNDAELAAVVGHELGHLMADHVVYKVMARLMLGGAEVISDLFKLLTLPLRLAMARWDQASELSADRAGLLACRDLAASLGTNMALAGGRRPGTVARTSLRVGAFVRQARELSTLTGESWWDAMLTGALTSNMTHPFAAWRVMHILDWVERGAYLDLLAGSTARTPLLEGPTAARPRTL